MKLARRLVVSVAYQKGGVGKTTSVVNLAAALARMGLKVIIFDFDQQSSVSKYLMKKKFKTYEGDTTYELLVDEKFVQPVVIIKGGVMGDMEVGPLHLVPGDIALAKAESYVLTQKYDRERIFTTILKDHYQDYDVVLVDCPPALGLLTINALTASQWVLFPSQPEKLSMDVFEDFMDTIKRVQSKLNSDLKIWRMLVNMLDSRYASHNETWNKIVGGTSEYDVPVWPEKIERRADVVKAASKGVDVGAINKELGAQWDRIASSLVYESGVGV